MRVRPSRVHNPDSANSTREKIHADATRTPDRSDCRRSHHARFEPVFAKASQPATPVNFDVPAGACDCHTHIHGDPEKFPVLRRPRLYAGDGAAEEMAALHRLLRVQRVVIVTRASTAPTTRRPSSE